MYRKIVRRRQIKVMSGIIYPTVAGNQLHEWALAIIIVRSLLELKNRMAIRNLVILILVAGIVVGVSGLSADPWKNIGLGIASSIFAAIIFAAIYQSNLERFITQHAATIITK